MQEPLFVAKKTMLKAATIWRVLFCWLIIPAIIWIIDAIRISKYTIEFYDNYIIERWGLLSKHEKKSAFRKILSVSIDQSLNGRIWHYGSLNVESVGKWDVNLYDIKNPQLLKEFLEDHLTELADNNTIITE